MRRVRLRGGGRAFDAGSSFLLRLDKAVVEDTPFPTSVPKEPAAGSEPAEPSMGPSASSQPSTCISSGRRHRRGHRRAQRAPGRPLQLGSVLVAIHCALLKGAQFQQLFLIIIHYSTLPHEPFNDETRCMPIRLERRDEGNMTKSRGQVKWPSTLTRTGRCLRRRGFSRDDRHAKLAA